jgi:hypothetical protein
LLALEEKMIFSLENIKRRQQTVKKYFNKRAKVVGAKDIEGAKSIEGKIVI